MQINKENDIDEWFNIPDEKMLDIINIKILKENSPDPQPTELVIEEPNEVADDHVQNVSNFVDVDKILETEPSVNSSTFDLIYYQYSISYFTQAVLNDSKKPDSENILTADKIEAITSYMLWISKSSKILATKIGQELYTDNITGLVRSSYNFCPNCSQCKNFYNKNEAPTCKFHHFVHSLMKYDVDSIIFFLRERKVEIRGEDFNNLCSSIKTVCYVTKRMFREIDIIRSIPRINYEDFHRNNPFDMPKKKKQPVNNKPMNEPNGFIANKSRNTKNGFKNKNEQNSSKFNSNNKNNCTNQYSILCNL